MMKYVTPLIGIFLFVNFILWYRADCFDCKPIYPSSISEWKNYTQNDTVLDSVAVNCGQIIALLNDTLFDYEEAIILNKFENAAEKGKMSAYLDYLSKIKPVDGDNRNALLWIYSKFDEGSPRTPKTLLGTYKRIFSLGTPEHQYYTDSVLYEHLETTVLSDKSLRAEAYEQWFSPIKSWQDYFKLYRKPKEEMPPEMQKFLIKRLSREFSFQKKYRSESIRRIEEMRIKFGLDSSQVFQY